MQVVEPTLRQPTETAECDTAAFIAALSGGGDSRLVLDKTTLTNKYLCPPQPVDTLTCLSSCTASPISVPGFESARSCYRDVMGGGGPRPDRLDSWLGKVKRRLRDLLGGDAVGDIVLLPSGTDAILFTALVLALESPGQALTAILPSAPETGSGVPLAAACRRFDGAEANLVLHEGWGEPLLVALRRPDGVPRSDGEINEGFAEAARAAPGRPVVFLTHGSKTGLVAPLQVPDGTDVVVDACQLRLSSASLQSYLRRGWPVVITGSKFLGGPAFCGAVLLPRGRFDDVRHKALATWYRRPIKTDIGDMTPLGPLLRWVAALSAVQQGSSWDQVLANMQRLQDEAETALRGLPGVRIMPGASGAMVASGGTSSGIITFALRDRRDRTRCLSVSDIQVVYKSLATRGVLIGQPISLGEFGGLRVAIGIGDIARGSLQTGLEQLCARLPQAWV